MAGCIGLLKSELMQNHMQIGQMRASPWRALILLISIVIILAVVAPHRCQKESIDEDG